MSKIEEYQRGYRDGIKYAVTFLHARADSRNDPDPKVRQCLHSAATILGASRINPNVKPDT